MNGETININGLEYISPNGYQNFGIRFDGEKKQYAIANIKTKETTAPFVDEVILSELKLETWVQNYVVVRIGELYYLCDCDGNCYLECSKAYIICRNVFVEASLSYCINELLTMVQMKDCEIVVTEYGGHKFAFWQYLPGKRPENEEQFYLIKPDGHKLKIKEIIRNGRFHSAPGDVDYSMIADWKFTAGSYSDGDTPTYFINNNFELIFDFFKADLIANKSKTYKEGGKFSSGKYSTYFHSFMDDIVLFGELEIVWYGGKTYFFMPNGIIEVVENSISYPQDIGDFIVYRENCEIIMRDKNGKIERRKHIDVDEAYKMALYEKLLVQDDTVKRLLKRFES